MIIHYYRSIIIEGIIHSRSGNIKGLRLYKTCTFGEPLRPGVRSLGYMRERHG